MQKSYTFRMSPEFLKILGRSKWILQKDVSEILRIAAVEYLKTHVSDKDILKQLEKTHEAKEAKGQEVGP